MKKFSIKDDDINVDDDPETLAKKIHAYMAEEFKEWKELATEGSSTNINIILTSMTQLCMHEMFNTTAKNVAVQMSCLLIAGKDISDIKTELIDQMEEIIVAIAHSDARLARRNIIKLLAQVKEDIPSMSQEEITAMKKQVGDDTGRIIMTQVNVKS